MSLKIETLDSIHNLELHEVICAEGLPRVQRVPGGWIYYYHTFKYMDGITVPISVSTTFVPYNKEFKKKG